MIDSKNLTEFLDEVRECKHPQCKLIPCEAEKHCTPFIYGRSTSNILVVSEAPPLGAWNQNKGATWINSLNISKDGDDIQSKVARWLDFTPDEAHERFFWIQRANCCVSNDWNSTYLRCGRQHLSKAVALVNPTAIITLGGVAAAFFFPKFSSLRSLIESVLANRVHPKSKFAKYAVFPFYHPSERTKQIRDANIHLHEKMVDLIRSRL